LTLNDAGAAAAAAIDELGIVGQCWATMGNYHDIHVFLQWTYGSGGCMVHHVLRNRFDHLRLRESYAEAAFAAEEAISIYQEGCAAASKRNLRACAFSFHSSHCRDLKDRHSEAGQLKLIWNCRTQ
jgi:uncharacterized membrane protein YeiH